MSRSRSSSDRLQISPAGVLAVILLLILGLTPIMAVVLGGTSSGWLVVAGFLALSFWPPTVVITRLALKAKELPRISGGPAINWAGKTYGPGYRHTS